MGLEDLIKDDAPEASTGNTSPSALTGTPTIADDVDDADDHFSGLLPGNTYMIMERESLRAITQTEDGLRLHDIHHTQASNNRWLCVEKNGWFGLQEPRSGKYIGHDWKFRVHAAATEFRAWECITTRDHPGGVYQLLVPHWWETLRTVVVAEDGSSLTTRQHGDTRWRFLKVSDT
jgi:hypothetical protein